MYIVDRIILYPLALWQCYGARRLNFHHLFGGLSQGKVSNTVLNVGWAPGNRHTESHNKPDSKLEEVLDLTLALVIVMFWLILLLLLWLSLIHLGNCLLNWKWLNMGSIISIILMQKPQVKRQQPNCQGPTGQLFFVPLHLAQAASHQALRHSHISSPLKLSDSCGPTKVRVLMLRPARITPFVAPWLGPGVSLPSPWGREVKNAAVEDTTSSMNVTSFFGLGFGG